MVLILSSYWGCGANTHTGPSNRSLLLHEAPSVKSTPLSPPFHEEYATANYQCSNYSGNIYLQLCVLLLQFIVSWFTEMQCDVMYLETWGSTQPYVAFDTCILFLFSYCFWNTCGTEFSYIEWSSVCCALSQVFEVDLWMGPVLFVLQSEVEAPFLPLVLGPSLMSVWIVSVIILNHNRWEL